MIIHEKDRELLAILSENARVPIAVLARRIGVARTTAQARLDRLEDGGVIAGYTVQLSDAYEQSLVRAHVMIVLNEKALSLVARQLASIAEVSTVHSVSGQVDLIAEVAAQSISDLDRVVDAIGELEGVARTQSSVILSTRLSR